MHCTCAALSWLLLSSRQAFRLKLCGVATTDVTEMFQSRCSAPGMRSPARPLVWSRCWPPCPLACCSHAAVLWNKGQRALHCMRARRCQKRFFWCLASTFSILFILLLWKYRCLPVALPAAVMAQLVIGAFFTRCPRTDIRGRGDGALFTRQSLPWSSEATQFLRKYGSIQRSHCDVARFCTLYVKVLTGMFLLDVVSA